MKKCSKCKEIREVSEFNKDKSSTDGLGSRCRECCRAACRDWYSRNADSERQKARRRARVRGPKDRERCRLWALANPERARYHSRNKLFKSLYNMTYEEHEALFASQGFKCAACGSVSPNSKKGWSTDHCHKTGVVRGILCHHCNVGFGHAKDNIGTLQAWISYLEKQ
jgi:Recombination endonuclease VII